MLWSGWYRFFLGPPPLLVSFPGLWGSYQRLYQRLVSQSSSRYFTSFEFFTQALTDSFHWSLSESKYLHVSRTLLSILANFSNAEVWIFSVVPLISSSSSRFLVTVPSSPTMIGITATFMFHRFFSSLARSRYLPRFSLSFTLWSVATANSPMWHASFFLLNYYHYYCCCCLIIIIIINSLVAIAEN